MLHDPKRRSLNLTKKEAFQLPLKNKVRVYTGTRHGYDIFCEN